jgi:HSF-type DNA-binding
MDLSTTETPKPSENAQSQKTVFPQVLYAMLQTATENGYADIVSWQSHGRSFRIKDKQRLVKEVMPLYFKQTKYSSLQRQLALWGFSRQTRKAGEDAGCYIHENFIRGDPDRIRFIYRVAIKKAASATSSEAGSSKRPLYSLRTPTTGTDKQLLKHDTLKLDSIDYRKLPSATISKTMSESGKDSTQNDDTNVNDDSLYESMDDNEEIDTMSMADFLSDVDL